MAHDDSAYFEAEIAGEAARRRYDAMRERAYPPHDSGEHDTLADQIAYEQEHGTREYQSAYALASLLADMDDLGASDAGIAQARRIAEDLAQSLAPRPTITPAGSIDDVPWTDDDQ